MFERKKKSKLEQVLQMPDLRSTLLAQDHLNRGVWKRRHIDRLAEDSRTRAFLMGMLECSNSNLDRQQSLAPDAPNAQQLAQKLHTKNLLCLCNAGCPKETQAWATCVRSASKALRAYGEPEEMCDVRRRRLERCMRNQTSIMLHTALMPPELGPTTRTF